ncbi:coiled-coil domain-containing protein SCD2 isoform X3 [Gossypium hirsutum]|uniref:Coiled-coil domain-containing protein SCD2 isoform X3 n=1 Tax=Gossypium hirsutum TaxID=3635 RepID=A0A1U8PT32_GOSHI|nr:coiled-coil domain-containing protein SCD2-like isoform X3 [Gossypium hirsutum]
MDRRRLAGERRQSVPAIPGAPSSPLQRHTRSGSSYGGTGNPRKAQTKAAAQRLAAVMAHQQNDDDGNDYDQLDHSSVSSTGSIGFSGARPTRPLSPMTKNVAQRRVPQAMTPQADDHNDEDDLIVSGRPSIGLGGARQMQARTPVIKTIPQRRPSPVIERQPSDDDNADDVPVSNTKKKSLAQTRAPPPPADDDENEEDDLLVSGTTRIGLGGRAVRPHSPATRSIAQKRMPPAATQQTSDKESDEEEVLVSGRPSIGLARGRAMQPRPAMVKTMAQRPVQQVPQQPSDENNDEDELANSAVSGKATIGLGGRARPSSSPLSVRIHQDQSSSTRSTPGSHTSLSVNTKEQPVSAHSINSVEQSMSPSAGRSSLQSSVEQLHTRQAPSLLEQPVSPCSTGPGRQQLRIKTAQAVPKPTSSGTTPEVSADSRREKRLNSDFASMGGVKDRGRQQSASALQDELDMLQDENESLLEKLHLAEERFEEAEARVRLLEKQIADLGEGATLEARLLSRKEAAQQEREAASRGGAQAQATLEQIAALQTEAEIARDETNSVLEKLSEAEFEIKALQTVTQRMMLTEEEMEEVVLKRCWLARYWSLCVDHGIQADIAGVKHEYWSSFAPLPVEIVLAAGQRAREEDISTGDDLEERGKVLQHTNELSGERNVESMLLVEKGLRELALLKVEDAVAFAMAKQRRQNMLKTEEVKLPTEGQFEVFELSQEESEDVRFKQAWLTYFWRRAMNHGVEADIADERLQSWIQCSSQCITSQEAVDVERGLMEIRRLGLESQLWKTSRRGLELGATARLHIETGF